MVQGGRPRREDSDRAIVPRLDLEGRAGGHTAFTSVFFGYTKSKMSNL